MEGSGQRTSGDGVRSERLPQVWLHRSFQNSNLEAVTFEHGQAVALAVDESVSFRTVGN